MEQPHKTEFYHLYGHPDTVGFIKINRLRWIGDTERMEKIQPTRQIVYQGIMSNRPRGRSRNKLKDHMKENLRRLNSRNWKTRVDNRTINSRINCRFKIK